MEPTPRSLLFSLSCVSLAVFLLIGVSQCMVDYLLPSPPIPPQNCTSPLPRVRQPSAAWLAAYFGKAPAPAGPGTDMNQCCNNAPMPPTGRVLEALGNETTYDPSEVDAGDGFRQVVPADEVWRLNWVRFSYVTNTGGANRAFIVRAFDNDDDLWYVVGRNDPGDNTGGPVSFMVNVGNPLISPSFFTESLPPDMIIWGGTTVLVQLGNAGTDFMNTARWNFDKWQVKPAPVNDGAAGPGGGPFFDYYAINPFFRLS